MVSWSLLYESAQSLDPTALLHKKRASDASALSEAPSQVERNVGLQRAFDNLDS